MENFSCWNFNSKLQLKKKLGNMKDFPYKGNKVPVQLHVALLSLRLSTAPSVSFSLHNNIYICNR